MQDQQKRHSTGETAEGALDAITSCDTPEVASERDGWRAAPQVTVQRPSFDGEDIVMLDDGLAVVEEGDQLRSGDAPVCIML